MPQYFGALVYSPGIGIDNVSDRLSFNPENENIN